MIKHKCIDYQGVLTFQVSLFHNALFGTVTYKVVNYSLFSSNEFHHINMYSQLAESINSIYVTTTAVSILVPHHYVYIDFVTGHISQHTILCIYNVYFAIWNDSNRYYFYTLLLYGLYERERELYNLSSLLIMNSW